MIQYVHRKAGIHMKKRFAGFVILAAAAAAVAALVLKKEEDPVLVTLDDEVDQTDENEYDSDYPLIKLSERQSWQTRTKILLKSLVDQKEIRLVHYCKFHNQHDLFEAVKEAKASDYTLAEADDKHQVVLEKTMENFFDDVIAAILLMANITRKHNGLYREFEIE